MQRDHKRLEHLHGHTALLVTHLSVLIFQTPHMG